MKYLIAYGATVQCYAHVTIEADSADEAKAKACDLGPEKCFPVALYAGHAAFNPDWETLGSFRIVSSDSDDPDNDLEEENLDDETEGYHHMKMADLLCQIARRKKISEMIMGDFDVADCATQLDQIIHDARTLTGGEPTTPHPAIKNVEWVPAVEGSPTELGGPSPWGFITFLSEIAPGIASVSTNSHGGIKLSPTRNKLVPEHIRIGSYAQGGRDGWYEEDGDWTIPYLLFPKEFDAHVAKLNAEDGMPDEQAAATAAVTRDQAKLILDKFHPGWADELIALSAQVNLSEEPNATTQEPGLAEAAALAHLI